MKVVTHVDKQAVVSAVTRATGPALLRGGYVIAKEAKRLLSQGGGTAHAPSTPGTPPHAQRGQLYTSVNAALCQTGGKPTVVAGPTEKYGKVHEFGKTIRPTAGHKWLTIPNPENQIAYGKRARSFDARFVPLKGRRDLALLVSRRRYSRTFGSRNSPGGVQRFTAERGDVLYWLKKRVTLPARPFMRPALRNCRAKIAACFKGAVKK